MEKKGMNNILRRMIALVAAGGIAIVGVAAQTEAVDTMAAAESWALVKVPVACMRSAKGHSSELASQVVMGTPVKLKQNDGDWWLAITPEGYEGWIIDNSLAHKSAEEMNRWRDAGRWVVTSLDEAYIEQWPGAGCPRCRVSGAVNGSIVEGVAIPGMEYIKVLLPDGREGYISASAVTPVEEWAGQPFDPVRILDLAYSMEGSPYLWGGTSTKSADCSGLSRIAYYNNGIIIRRDADQQAKTGRRIEPSDTASLRSGDLLFFGNPETRRVTHVAIYDKDGMYVHSSGRVKRNSIDPNNSHYLTTPYLWAVNISDCVGSDGITQAAQHPWYFNR